MIFISLNPSQAATVLDFVAVDFQELPVEKHLTAASGVNHLRSWESKFNVPTDGANVLFWEQDLLDLTRSQA